MYIPTLRVCQENHIVTTIHNNQKQIYLPLLKEHGVYSVSNFKVVPGPALYRSVDRDFAINFFYKTKIEEKPDTCVIPLYKFELQPFDKVKSLVGQIKCLIDVIGMVLSYGQLEKRSNGAEKMDVVLINERNEKIVITLWEERAYHFLSSMAEIEQSALFVVITGLIAKRFSDNASLSSSDATKSYFNIDYKPLHDLKEAAAALSGKNSDSLPPPTSKKFVSIDDSSVQELPVKSVLEIKIPVGKDVVRCLCKGTITEILNGNGWYYNCCTKCAPDVRLLEGKYYCNACTEDDIQVAQRYRVVVRIEDESGSTTLTMFNKEAEQLIGVPLPKVLAEVKENSSMTEIPPAVKKHCREKLFIQHNPRLRGIYCQSRLGLHKSHYQQRR